MADEKRYTTIQVAIAARELREAAGSEEELFSGDDVIRMLNDEVRMLRERGFTDEHIAELFQGFEIEVTTEQIAQQGEPKL